ncbi:MAG: hypothetical protein OSA98_05600 [Rubripirellula sp.]|jgi:hypothetical protein|nr:hypothetical protein [Rubripirellula sp.]|tara:strand:- start:1302 stop:1607 length:306 start_codon:yes stop_codon:yes gene_type:complete
MVRLTQDLTSTKWIYAKGFLFMLLSVVAGLLILVRTPRWDILALLLICVWASCRAYYFAFYVIEHYVDPGFRFSGLFDFVRYLMHRDQKRVPVQEDSDQSA